MISRRSFFFGSLALPAFAAKPAPLRPNILLIAVDHLPAWVLGCYGNKEILTPNMDRLALTGTRFLRHFTSAPAAGLGRAVLLTGRTPMQLHESAAIPPGEVSLEKMLGGAGYATASVDSSAAANFIDGQAAGKPFSLVVTCAYLNRPYEAIPQKYRDQYAATKFDTFNPETSARSPESKEMLADVKSSLRKYAAAVSALDGDIGAILAKLSARRLLDNTLVIVTSTCGALLSHHGLWGAGDASEPPNMYEEAVATPLIWSWVGHVPTQLTRPEMVSTYDLVPTLGDLLGIDVKGRNLCGRSYLPLATGKPLPKKQPWPTTVFAHLGNTDMAREERYKVVLRSQGPGELYAMVGDSAERQNQFDNPQFLTVRTELSGKIAAWKQKYST